MKYIKPISLILCAVIILVLVSADVSSSEGRTPGRYTAAAIKMHSPDTIMLSAGDLSVSWGELYFLIHTAVSQVTAEFTQNLDWDEPSSMGETWVETILNYAIEQAELTMVYRHGINELGVYLTDEELIPLMEYIEEITDESGNLENLAKDLADEGFMSVDVFRQMIIDDELQAKLPSVLYGPEYNDISDEKVADYAERNDLMRAKHILLSFPSEYEGYSAEEIEERKSEQLEKAEELLSELTKRKDDDDFTEFFSELVMEHSEDPGSISFPDGYLFQPYEMVPEFSSACEALDIGEMSGIVETAYGYHILLRLPLDFEAVPYGLMSQGQNYSLRMLAVFEDFDNRVIAWRNSLNVERSPQLDSLNITKIFKWS